MMKYKLHSTRRSRQRGYVMISAMALTTIMLAAGVAFMHWASDESQQSTHVVAGMQAYYLAKMGVVEEGLTWLRSQQAGLLPMGEIRLGGREIEGLGKYTNVTVAPVYGGLEESQNFFNQRKYRVTALGTAKVPWMGRRHREDVKEVTRKAVLYVSVRSFADYMYLSDQEETWNGETIRFFNGDTLWGRTHSNDTIHIMQSPVFYDIVSTSAPFFGRGIAYNPQFEGPDPFFNAPRVDIPYIAQNVRDGASTQGHFYGLPGEEWRIHFNGASLTLYHWEEGAPFDSITAVRETVNHTGLGTCLFIDGPLSMKGEVTRAWTIGCSQDIYLLDNVWYSCAGLNVIDIADDCEDYLGLVSEGLVIIANTPENGRENSNGAGRGQTNQNLTSIVIHAAIVALGESFTFDQQNDIWESYICGPPFCPADERGFIRLRGSVTQRRRGYVHRSNNGGTGYLKDYRYDYRFLGQRPPCFLDAVDESGRALFNVIQWGQSVEDPIDVRFDNRVRYN